MTREQLRRIAVVTLGLSVAGAVVGAALGVLAVAGLLVALGGRGADGLLVIAGGFGAVLGLVLAPIAAWTLMRHVPLWRAITETGLGTALGSAAGWVLAPVIGGAALWPLALGLVGFGAAALRLRLTYRGAERGATAARLTPAAAGAVRVASRTATLAASALLLTLASSAVPGTRLEVQEWDCPPAPASCARPVAVRGFPLPYIADYHGTSPGGASLLGALYGLDYFRVRPFLANLALYAAALAGAGAAWARARRGRSSLRV